MVIKIQPTSNGLVKRSFSCSCILER